MASGGIRKSPVRKRKLKANRDIQSMINSYLKWLLKRNKGKMVMKRMVLTKTVSVIVG